MILASQFGSALAKLQVRDSQDRLPFDGLEAQTAILGMSIPAFLCRGGFQAASEQRHLRHTSGRDPSGGSAAGPRLIYRCCFGLGKPFPPDLRLCLGCVVSFCTLSGFCISVGLHAGSEL